MISTVGYGRKNDFSAAISGGRKDASAEPENTRRLVVFFETDFVVRHGLYLVAIELVCPFVTVALSELRGKFISENVRSYDPERSSDKYRDSVFQIGPFHC